ncbi:SDR family NAD(P)-dependent oxidoreductase [Fulvivirga kasyanovii]|uniref:SDR family NAD(P)-dependent oxidoreductase n=5 Tax=Fulvivirga kasyanovii TaxID=396812 RepID=A0ABW9RPW9_9BACT|nr:SDR family NAD(P)-dependent oxidoreductase [Fulvivirga kasyanovii]MTI25797.1 SDR family NAD(P)-dependent oxidoreductase [Fulvivirga kasyanovii]
MMNFLSSGADQQSHTELENDLLPTIEETLQADVADLLDIPETDIYLTDTFDEQGMDLVRRKQFIQRVKSHFNIDLSFNDMVSHNTLALISRYCYELHTGQKPSERNSIKEEEYDISVDLKSRYALKEIAYTLQVGRDEFSTRLAIVTESIADLYSKLRSYVNNEDAEYYTGIVNDKKDQQYEIIDKAELSTLVQKQELLQIAQYWLEGKKILWKQLYANDKVNRISLPTYPFAKDVYWVKGGDSTQVGKQLQSKLTPLLDGNNSLLRKHSYNKHLTANDYFMKDHVINGQMVLPGVVYLEMARMAAELACPGEKVVQITNVTWIKTLAVNSGEGRHINTELRADSNKVIWKICEDMAFAQGEIHMDNSVSKHGSFTDIDQLKSSLQNHMGHEAFYERFAEGGFKYGATFTPLQEIYFGDDTALAYIKTPDALINSFADYVLHPSLMEGSLQTAGLLANYHQPVGSPYVPYEIASLNIYRKMESQCWVLAKEKEATAGTANIKRYDLQVMNSKGEVCVEIQGYAVRQLKFESQDENRSLFARKWKPSQVPARNHNPEHILYFADKEAYKKQHEHVTAKYGQVKSTLVKRGAGFSQKNGQVTINMNSEADFEQLVKKLFGNPNAPDTIVWHLGAGNDMAEGIQEVDQSLQDNPVFLLTQALIKEGVSRNVLQLFIGESSPRLNALSSFGKSISLEYKYLRFKTVEVDDSTDEYLVPSLECIDASEPQISYKAAQRNSLEWHKITTETSFQWRDNGVYLITGGNGGVARELIKLLEPLKARVALIGRSPLSAELKSLIEQQEAKGVLCTYLRADITDRNAMVEVLRSVNQQYGAINGIFHCAGIINDALFRNLDLSDFNEVLAPKVTGTIVLDEITRSEPLDFFVLFSSITSVLGNAGQSAYAYANGFMDAFAEERSQLVAAHKRHGRTVAINWPLWNKGGMQLSEERLILMEKHMGAQPLSSEMAWQSLSEILATSATQVFVWSGKSDKVSKLLEGTPLSSSESTPKDHSPGNNEEQPEQLEVVIDHLLDIITQITQLDRAQLSITVQLDDYGFDSITLTELANAINQQWGLEIMPTFFFEVNPFNTEELAKSLLQKYGNRLKSADSEVKQVLNEQKADETPEPFSIPKVNAEAKSNIGYEPIAVVGMSGVMPGSEDLNQFWDHLESGTDLVTEIPVDRWDWRDYFGDPAKQPNTSQSKWGAFISGIDEFDAEFFNISPNEAKYMDPQQRMALQVIWKTIENAGYKPSSFKGSRTALYLGVSNMDYAELLDKIPASSYGMTGNNRPFIVNRISYLLNLRGASEPIDTLCSSSLVAVDRAIQDIHNGTCDQAIAAGINIIITPKLHLNYSAANMLSVDGKCKTFDKAANGFVRGEGVAGLLLKTLSKAEADGDYIYGVIRGSAVNHGGMAKSITAPNVNAQAEVVMEAYNKASVSPDTISYIETHGTGTVIGDPTEINGLKKAFETLYKKQNITMTNANYCALGSVKTNIGHLESGAGIAGLVKVLLAMQHKKIPASLHIKEQNPYIDLESSPFYLSKQTHDWRNLKKNGSVIPLRAGVSSFGAGGVNAHVIVEEYVRPEEPKRLASSVPLVFVLSAKNEQQLKVYATEVKEYLSNRYGKDDIYDIVYTMTEGRDAMEARCAMIIGSLDELLEKLTYAASGEWDRGAIEFYVTEEGTKQQNQPITEHDSLEQNVRYWVKGGKVLWRLPDNGEAKKIPMPTYPFAKEKHWIKTDVKATNETDSYPFILKNNTANGHTQFLAHLSPDDDYIRDHEINGQIIVPGVLYMEIVRACIGMGMQKEVNRLNDITWYQPITFPDLKAQEVFIQLEEIQGGVKYLVTSGEEGQMTHSTGRLMFGVQKTSETALDLNAIRQKCDRQYDKQTVYEKFAARGFNYGDKLQVIQNLWLGDTMAVASLKIPDMQYHDALKLHPAILDGSLQALIEFDTDEHNAQNYLPFAVDSVELYQKLPGHCYASITKSSGRNNGQVIKKYDIVITDESGGVVARIHGLAKKLVSGRIEIADDSNTELLMYTNEFVTLN